MLMSFPECLERYGTEYAMRKAIAGGELHRIEKGVYSDRPGHVAEEEILRKKYPDSVLTLQSAFMYHSFSDTVPDLYSLATGPKAAVISDRRVKQYFMPDGTLEIGRMEMDYDGVKIVVYDLERLLIELMRFRTKLPFDYYKEVVKSYRENVDKIYPAKIDDYLEAFPRRDAIEDAIDREVF